MTYTEAAVEANGHDLTTSVTKNTTPDEHVATKAVPPLPQWEQLRTEMKNSFPGYHAEAADTFRADVDSALQKLEAKRPHPDDCPVYLGDKAEFVPTDTLSSVRFPEEGAALPDVMDRVVDLFDGLNNPANPLFQYNIICHPNKAALIASLLGNYVSPNFISGHSAWNVTSAERECAAMVSNLVESWDATKTSGFFTYGGAGCYLYGVKYALRSVYRKFDLRAKGMNSGGKIIMSKNGHHANEISADWLGIGTDNIRTVHTDPHTNTMSMAHLETILQEYTAAGDPVVCIVCTIGTTDEMVVDPVDEVRLLIEKYPNPPGYARPHIYCDSVAGWAFLTFNGYDFTENPLGFSAPACSSLRNTYDQVRMLQHADSFSIDFHKTGWCNYTTSMYMIRDREAFESVMEQKESHIIHKRTMYNPGQYTLEVSRSAAPALGAWASLQHFGLKGYRTLLGGVVEMSFYLRSLIAHEPSMIVLNAEGCALNTAIRVYPNNVDAVSRYRIERSDGSESGRALLKQGNDITKAIADRIWKMSRNGELIDGEHVPIINFSAAFGRVDYFEEDMTGSEGVVFALKAFPFNINVDKRMMDRVLYCIKAVRDIIVDEMRTEL